MTDKKYIHVGDNISVKTYLTAINKIYKCKKLAKVLAIYPRFVLLDLGKFKTCVMKEDLAKGRWIAI